MAEDFVWCDERWGHQGDGPHVCAEHRPGHAAHRCCCGSTPPAQRTPEADRLAAHTDGGQS